MKKKLLLLAVIFSAIFSFGQEKQKGFGFDLGYSISRSAMADVKYFMNENAFSLGFTYQFNNALGKRVAERPVGAVPITNDNFFYTVDLGYTRVLNENFSVGGEFSIGSKRYWTSFIDNSSSAGAFHVITKTKAAFGVGGIVTYNVTKLIGIFAGYNSLRELDFGLEFRFLH